MIALIMAGGFGTRFWPQSRASLPKQFLRVVGESSMLQLTVERLLPLIPLERVFIVTAAGQENLVREHLPLLPEENIILEPFGMNTAPCIALSLAYLKSRFPLSEKMLVLPADHVIKDVKAFHESLKAADSAASDGYLTTFGIIPDHPATGYGYIEAGKPIPDKENAYEVTRFKEKPDLQTATAFLSAGGFYWNSGMFYWSLEAIDDAFKRYLPKVNTLCEGISRLWEAELTDISELYRLMPKIPIDIGIMEPAARRAVIPVKIGWSDVGSWKALSELSPADALGNSLPQGYTLDSRGNYVYSSKFTALIGVENLCIVETPDALLITTKEQAEDVKKIVDYLKEHKRNELL